MYQQNPVDSLQILMDSWTPHQPTQQNGDKVSSEIRNVEFRLCLKNVPKVFEVADIEDLYSVTSEMVHFPKRNSDRDGKQHGSRMVFIQFKSKSDAESAKNQINSNKNLTITATFAEKPRSKQSSSQQQSTSNATTESSFTFSSTSAVSEKTKFHKVQIKEEFTGSCERCGRNSKLVCDVCSSFYCSTSCQRKDWITHKIVCRPMPKLVKASEKYVSTSDSNDEEDSTTDSLENFALSESKSMTTISNGTESSGVQKGKYLVPFVDCTIVKKSIVVITAISSINRLYIRQVGGDYNKIVAKIAAYVSKAKKQDTFPEVDDVVLAPFDGIFYRAQILSINAPDTKGNDLIVLFIDYGNISKVSSKNLRKLDYIHRQLKRHAFKVTLSDVNCSIVSEASMQYLNDLLSNKENLEVADVIINHNDRFVTLLKSSTRENVNKTIMKLSVVQEVTDNEEVVMCDDIKPLPLPTGQNITLFVTDCNHLDHGFIGCMPMDSVQALLQTEKAIEEYGFRTKDMKYSPIKNELCLILVDKHWYRAAVVEQLPNTDEFNFYLIDWCRLEINVSNENIRKMPKQFGNPQPKAHLCCIMDRSSVRTQNIIKQAKVNSSFTVTSIVLNKEQQFCINF
ncbi:unnamed protein product [Diamesa hyperborea]